MKGCGRYEDLIALFLHGETLLQDREELEAHIAVCTACERAYRDARDIDHALRELPDKTVDPPPYLRTRILARLEEETVWASRRAWGRWAAAAAACLAGVLAAVVYLRSGTVIEPRDGSGPATDRRVASAPAEVREKAVPPPQADGARAPDAAPKSPAAAQAGPEAIRIIKEVRIYFYYPPAQNVAVTGDFNDWDPKGVPLKRAGKPGLWVTDLRLKPGAYSYNFIVDGDVLVPDPNAANQMPDGYGGTNSILLVKGDSA